MSDRNARPRVLVVEDEVVIAFAVEEYLGAKGYEVDSAIDLPEASERLAHERYDVLVTDLRLSRAPECEGLSVLRAACALESPPHIVVLTAFTSSDEAAEALSLGARHLLTKPVDLLELETVISRLMASCA